MGIPGLINAIGAGERVSLAKVAISHLERTARPIRIAVDISIWLFQVQASRGGKNPELRTLYYRLLKLLALPIHPLFVYDGRHKPPFKRGKAVSSRSSGNPPLIQRSKDLIERFRFPWHEAPGEAEAECARLQQAGIVDAVMSNDVDTLMFGSTFTIKNFSKESGSGTTGATHVTCYHMGNPGYVSNVPFDRAGMILFAMLSGGDYLPSGVPKCGSKLAAEIAKAKFGEDLLTEIAVRGPDLDSRLGEWRERLQYELDENESGWFATKHKAVRIPKTFPDRTILEYYAEPKVSTEDEMADLRRRLKHAWDREIDPLAIRSFAADNFEWNYRSGARKVIKNLAEPLVAYKLRLQRPVSAVPVGSLAPQCDEPWLQKVYKSRVCFGTDGLVELQIDILPIDVVGLDLMAEEPNPPLPSQETEPSQGTVQSGDEEDDAEIAADGPPPTPSKSRVTKRYDIYAIQKVWVLETVARLGLPVVVQKWEDEQAAKANKAAAPKKSSSRRTGPKKKGPIDPGMKRGSILKYGTLTKETSELSASNRSLLLEAASTKTQSPQFQSFSSSSQIIDLEDDAVTPSMYPQQQASDHMRYSSREVTDLIDTFSSLSTMSPTPIVKRHPMTDQSRVHRRAAAGVSGGIELDESSFSSEETVDIQNSSLPAGIRLSYSVTELRGSTTEDGVAQKEIAIPMRKSKRNIRSTPKTPGKAPHAQESAADVDSLERSIDLLSLSVKHNIENDNKSSSVRVLRQPASSKMEKQSVPDCPPKIWPVNILLPSERPVPLQGHPAATVESAIKLKQRHDEHAPPSETKPSARKSRNDSMDPLKPSIKAKEQVSEHKQTKGHIENITVSNGIWTVDPPTQTETKLVDSNVRKTAIEGDTGHGKKPQNQKKRVARVSILDLS
ncbi:uncharacterized protein N7482_000468 [Penicillium canariense]|uniref:Uncharacterized protein n=1 Tax=Penicillium canariense TaxID=189055 RepID=A0A9W9LS66_9EURO|nr:uncharacterized protein N7482_000468 [Penicillium canariense]KAJ5174591.1 hypothetical protein N7482_000468 [Penicillium canariense]